MGKMSINPELYDEDSPTFHLHRSRIKREFKAAHSLKNAEPNVKYNEKPKEIKRLNSIIGNNDLADEASARLSELSKIFCTKQIRDFTHKVTDDVFQIQVVNSNAHLRTMSSEAGTNNEISIDLDSKNQSSG